MMTLLDYFSCYHQIWLHREDEKKTSFITPFGTYCYLRMPEGLRNAGPTFYRMMKIALKDQVGRNILSNTYDIVVVSKKKATYISDLAETFANMREVHLKLNPEKCIFGVTRGKVLGVLSLHERHQSKPRQNQSHHLDAASAEQEKSPETNWLNSSIEHIYSEARREKPSIFHRTQGLHKSRMGSTAVESLLQI
jgi:hypothetical protein